MPRTHSTEKPRFYESETYQPRRRISADAQRPTCELQLRRRLTHYDASTIQRRNISTLTLAAELARRRWPRQDTRQVADASIRSAQYFRANSLLAGLL